MRIDAHHHVWSLARGDYAWLSSDLEPLYRDFEPEMLEPLLRNARIERTLLVQAAPTDAETTFLLDIAARTPWIAGVVGWTDLSDVRAPDRISELADRDKLVGLRPMLQDIDDPDWILRSDVAGALDAMARTGLVLDLLVSSAQRHVIAAVADRHPTLHIVVDHAAKPKVDCGVSEGWAAAMSAAAGHPNVTVKLSGLLTQALPGVTIDAVRPFFDWLLAAFGPSRLLWGSDWPVLNLVSNYGVWWAMTDLLLAPLPIMHRNAILGGNAARIYGIGVN